MEVRLVNREVTEIALKWESTQVDINSFSLSFLAETQHRLIRIQNLYYNITRYRDAQNSVITIQGHINI